MRAIRLGIGARLLVSAGIAALSAGPALADASSSVLETVVVTAQKREQDIQKVGVAVTAIGPEALASLGHTDVTAIADLTPSVQFNQYSPTLTVFNIRGVSQNDFSDSQEAPVAFYSDGVYVSSMGAISGQMYDLQQIEVLRGPQGTLFGRNATGGVIQVTSAKPTDDLTGYLQASGGSFNEVATEGAISDALSNSVRARLSFQTDSHDGYIKNLIGPDLGDARAYAARLQVDADVGNGGDLLVKFWFNRNDHEVSGAYSHHASYTNAYGGGVFLPSNVDYYGSCPGCDPFGYKDPNGPFTGSYNRKGLFDRTYAGMTATYTQAFDYFNFTSITGYQLLHKRYGEDSDMSPNSIFIYDTNQYLLQGSEELRLDGQTDRLHWVTGIYLLDINSRNGYDANVLVGSEDIVYRTKTDTFGVAAFAQAEYALSDQFSAIAGVRYSWDQKKYWYTTTDSAIPALDFTFNPTLFPSLASRTFPNYSYKAELDYKPSDNALVYVSVNRGTKAGGFATPSNAPVDSHGVITPSLLDFDQEVLTNFEGGFKLTLFGGSTRFNGTIFHYDYHNYQAFAQLGLTQQITNNQAYVNGAELELTTMPVAGLTLDGFASFLDTEVKAVHVLSGDIINRRMPQAPHVSLGLSGQYTTSLGGGDLSLQTDWKYDGAQYFSVFNAPVDWEASHILGNARISYVPAFNKNLELAFFVKNITDKTYRVYNLDLANSFGFDQSVYAPPRWFGVSLQYNL